MKKILILMLFVHSLTSFSQQIELDYCLNSVYKNYPLLKQKNLDQEINAIAKKINNTSWLPQISANAQATYQSDVTSVSLPNSNLPTLSKDQYKTYVAVDQKIYDGGVTKIKNELENLSQQLNNTNVDIEIRNIIQQTQKYFFSVVIAQQNLLIIETNQNDINQRIKVLEAAIKFGTVKQNEIDILKVQLLKLDQNAIQVLANKKTGIAVINLLSGLAITDEASFKTPTELIEIADNFTKRPEFKRFEIQKENIDHSLSLTSTKQIPKVSLFGQAGYGKPGLNSLKNEFDTYYIVGAKLNWDLSGFYTNKKNKTLSDINKQSIDVQKEVLEINLKTQKTNLDQKNNELAELIEKDLKIVELRTQIAKVKAVELDNGVTTATNYIIEKNAEMEALQSLTLHQIQKIATQYDIKILTGN